MLDLDNNGTISREEVLESWEMYLRPHPVNPEFRMDNRLDANGNGFVEPQEIGIAAGFTRGRPIPSFDERLEQLGWQYYLNIKLISVETGEIIGSSIDEASDATGFYQMCNQAVYKLF